MSTGKCECLPLCWILGVDFFLVRNIGSHKGLSQKKSRCILRSLLSALIRALHTESYCLPLFFHISSANIFIFIMSWNESFYFFSIQINQPIRCNSFSSLLFDVYVQLNMFRASSRPSSGTQQLQ